MTLNTVDQLHNDIMVLSRSVDIVKKELVGRRDTLADIYRSKKKELVSRRELVRRASVPPFMGDIPLILRLWSLVNRRRLSTLSDRLVTMEDEVNRILEEGRSVEKSLRTLKQIATRIGKTQNDIPNLDHPPKEVSERLRAISGSVAGLPKKRSVSSVLEIAKSIVVVVDAWAKAGRLSRAAAGDSDSARIWLPIPFNMSYQATALGAKQDFSIKGASRFYVETGDPLARFDSLLPHGFRENRPKLRFSSIRTNAHRQNIWSFMDSLSWDHIRNVNYAMTGRRCILCGKQSGRLVRRLEPDKPNKVGTVECHEVWNWTQPDPDIPVGVQSLERIMVVCFDCHMCFHDDIARGKALAIGDVDLEKQVHVYLTRRRASLTGMAVRDVALEMKAESERLNAHRNVGTWIVDLSKLAKQDYMFGQTPTFIDSNPAGLKASHIAGISFRDGSGIIHPAIPPERLYQEVAMKWITQPEPTYQVMSRK